MTIVPHSTCLGCGCACDDIDVVVHAGRIIEARNACPLGVAWFGDGSAPARARVDGREVAVNEALDAAAAQLARGGRRLVYLAPGLSCESQRAGVAVADAARALLDTVTTATALATMLAQQERGRAGATLGEIRNRADVVVFWGVDPLVRYPRYPTRYAPGPPGVHVPDGRRSRTVIAVDVGDARGPADADIRVAMTGAEEVDVLTALAALAIDSPGAGRPADPAEVPGAGAPPEAPHGNGAWARARQLAPALLGGRYVAIVADGEPDPRRSDRDLHRASGLIALAQALNRRTRAAVSVLRGGGNRSGADAVATWQTGYPTAVDFARGYPRYCPHDGAAVRLARGEVDAALVLGDPAAVPEEIASALSRVPCACIGPRAGEHVLARTGIAIDTAVPGVHEDGTAIRLDDVPVPLRAVVGGPPAAAGVIRALASRVAAAVQPRGGSRAE